jgi:hypothetical protein
MGIKPPQENFKVSDRMNGIAEQAFFAGRAECMIRRTPITDGVKLPLINAL